MKERAKGTAYSCQSLGDHPAPKLLNESIEIDETNIPHWTAAGSQELEEMNCPTAVPGGAGHRNATVVNAVLDELLNEWRPSP
jgi:hypothetical protein